jgi:hypothetical protein
VPVTLRLPQKWSDHCPVALDLEGIPQHDGSDVPAPCKLSSRFAAKSSLGALFLRAKRKPDAALADGGLDRTAAERQVALTSPPSDSGATAAAPGSDPFRPLSCCRRNLI